MTDQTAFLERTWSSAWSLPERITVSQWAERYRVLDERLSPEPGPWRTDRTPYTREPMDAFCHSLVEEITLMWGTQLGKTEIILNQMGYAAMIDPGPGLHVMPRKADARNFAKNRVLPMFTDAAFEEQKTGRSSDVSLYSVRFERSILYFGYAESTPTLSSNPVRYLWIDEKDKGPRWSGEEGDPPSLARERTKNFYNRVIVNSCSPTTKYGYIYQDFMRSDRRQYWVPCPHCGWFQVLRWPGVKFPDKTRDPEAIKRGRLAWYECEHCHQRIEDGDKPEMLAAGKWVRHDETLDPATGQIKEPLGMSIHVGYQLSSIYSPWLTFSDVAAEFLRTKDIPAMFMTFVNGWLGEKWEEKSQETKPDYLHSLKLDYSRGRLPEGALILTAGVDVQKYRMYYVIRGWSADEESWLVHEGECEDWLAVETILFRSQYKTIDDKPFAVRMAFVDSGYRTDEVYDFCRAWGAIARPVKGSNALRAPFQVSRVDRNPRTGEVIPGGLQLYHVDTGFFKDKLHRLIHAKPEDPCQFHLHSNVTDDYIRMMTAEQKVGDRNKRTGEYSEEWSLVDPSVPNHYWDAEVYALAAADMLGVRFWKTGPVTGPAPGRQQSKPQKPSWLGQRRNGWLK